MNRSLLILIALSAVACSSNEDPTNGGGSGGTHAADAQADGTTDGSDSSTPDAALDAPQESATDAIAEAAAPDAPQEASEDAPADAAHDALDADADATPVSSCNEIGAADCFANNECDADDRCENVGTSSLPVACCVPGARGAGQAGDPCDDENDCESGVCIAGSGPYRCSATCTSNADCPDGMKDCTFIAFSGSNDMWCLPTD